MNSPHSAVHTRSRYWRLLRADRFAFAAVVILVAIVGVSVAMGPLAQDAARSVELSRRNLAPFSGTQDVWYLLGADPLGRSVLGRVIVAGATTLTIATSAVTIAVALGGSLGLVAGYAGGRIDALVARTADMMLSFPTLLFAVLLIYLFQPTVLILVTVLAVTRLPAYLRVVRAETIDIRSRDFVAGARAMGASPARILTRHVAPAVLPTLLTFGSVDLAYVLLLESSLSFLGQGVQSPDISWGLLVAEGRNYLLSAWWLTLFPGLAITVTTISLNLISAWLRLATDARHRWRLQGGTCQAG